MQLWFQGLSDVFGKFLGHVSEKGINDALKLYTYGKSSYLEVITAQNNKLQNDLSTISVILEKLSAEVDLYRVLGGGIN